MNSITQFAPKTRTKTMIITLLATILSWTCWTLAEEPHPFELDHEPHHAAPWLETMISDPMETTALNEYDCDIDFSILVERSETVPFIRAQPGTGVISSIQGRFPSQDPLQTFFELLADLDLYPDPEQWVVLAEGPYGDGDQSILRLERRNPQGLALAGGQVQLIFDAEMVYAIEGRLARELPFVETGPLTAEELLESHGGLRIMGPFLYDPQYSTIDGLDIEWPQQPAAVFSVIGEGFSALIDSFGDTLQRFDWELEHLPYGEEVLAQQSFGDLAITLIEQTSGSRWVNETNMTHTIRPEYQHHLDPYFGHFVLNVAFWYLYVPNYLRSNGPYWREFIMANKQDAPTNLKGFTRQDWDQLTQSLVRNASGMGSYYATEPKIIVANPNGLELGYEETAGRRIWLERLATMVWFEASQKPSWQMRQQTVAQRKSLWDMTYTYQYSQIYNHGHYFYDWKKTGFGSSHRPIAEYTFLRAKGIIDLTSMSKTAANLAHYFRRFIRHKGSRFDTTKRAWNRHIVNGQQVYGLNPEHLQTLSYRDAKDQFSVTWGCWHTTGMMCSLLRQLGIPAENREVELSPNSYHSRIYLPSLNQSVIHSDDFYTTTAISAQVNHQHLFRGVHRQPGRQQFRLPKEDIFLSNTAIEAIVGKTYSGLSHGVTLRGPSCQVGSFSGTKTAGEARDAAIRRAYMVEWGSTQLEWYHLTNFLNDDLDDYLIRWDANNALIAGSHSGYAEDFGLAQREAAYRLAYQIIQAKGLSNLQSPSYRRSKAFKSGTMPSAPPQCP